MTDYLDHTLAKRLMAIKDEAGKPIISSLIGHVISATGYYLRERQSLALPNTLGQKMLVLHGSFEAIERLAESNDNLMVDINRDRQRVEFLLINIIDELRDYLRDRATAPNTNFALQGNEIESFSDQLTTTIGSATLARQVYDTGRSWDFIRLLKEQGIPSPTLDKIKPVEDEGYMPWKFAADADLLKMLSDQNFSGREEIYLATKNGSYGGHTGVINLQKIRKDLEKLAISVELLANDSDQLVEIAKNALRRREFGIDLPEDAIDQITLGNVTYGLDIKDPKNLGVQLRDAIDMIDEHIAKSAEQGTGLIGEGTHGGGVASSVKPATKHLPPPSP